MGNKASSGSQRVQPHSQPALGRKHWEGQTIAVQPLCDQEKTLFLHSTSCKIAPHDTLANEGGVTIPVPQQLGRQGSDSEVQGAAQGHTVAQS